MHQLGALARVLPGIHVSRAQRLASPSRVAADPEPLTQRERASGALGLESGEAGRITNEAKAAAVHAPRFSATERTQLLLAPRIGPRLVEHLERAGFTSIAQMRAVGARRVLARVSKTIGTPCCHNRAKALERAIGQGPGHPESWSSASVDLAGT